MKVSDFERLAGAKCLTGEYEDREIASGYTCDLLSHVMGKGQADMAWITVQTHMNVIAVASLLDFACVIIPENLPVEAPIIEKAKDEDIIIFSSEKTAYELVALLAQNGVVSARKG
ncbi:MAG: AraC family transcriptional regulator [Clostridia bacterium]|nr:AraC family transcriptional regulator [Clostridia bacterium]